MQILEASTRLWVSKQKLLKCFGLGQIDSMGARTTYAFTILAIDNSYEREH